MSWRLEQIALMRAPRRLGKEQLAIIRAPFRLCPNRLALARPVRRGSLEEVTARVKRFVEGARHDRHPTGFKYDPETGTRQIFVLLDGEWLDLPTAARTDYRAYDTARLLVDEFMGDDGSLPPSLVEFNRWCMSAERPSRGKGKPPHLARNLTIYVAVEALKAAGLNRSANFESAKLVKNASACGLVALWGGGRNMQEVARQHLRISKDYENYYGAKVLIDWLLGSGGPES